jgi:hypothetical protein
LAAAGVDLDWFERAGEVLDGRHARARPGRGWPAVVSTQALLSEVKESTGRISALVDAGAVVLDSSTGLTFQAD